MNNEEIHITKSAKETNNLGKSYAKKVKSGDFLAFYGNLGGGKTTFIQGLAEGLNITRRIISPTFIIVRHYNLKKGSFYHIDLYRTQTKHDLLSVGLDEIINNNDNITAVEWSDKLGDLKPKKRIEFYFEYLNEEERKIKIKKYE
jgi:tRNA threonylcarbamoyladenosine biosynthesis protein TsaE